MSGTFDYETQPQIAARQAANVEWLTAPYKRIIHHNNAVTCDNRRLFLSSFFYTAKSSTCGYYILRDRVVRQTQPQVNKPTTCIKMPYTFLHSFNCLL